jgi:hypothetical protein
VTNAFGLFHDREICLDTEEFALSFVYMTHVARKYQHPLLGYLLSGDMEEMLVAPFHWDFNEMIPESGHSPDEFIDILKKAIRETSTMGEVLPRADLKQDDKFNVMGVWIRDITMAEVRDFLEKILWLLSGEQAEPT